MQAIADIRDVLRPANWDIDAIPAEQLLALVRRILGELVKSSTPSPIDLPEAIRRAIESSQRVCRSTGR